MPDCKLEYCGICGREKKPLLNELFCPNDCDRRPQLDFALVEEPTLDLNRCPKCNSLDTGPFNLWGIDRKHCIDCGHVWIP